MTKRVTVFSRHLAKRGALQRLLELEKALSTIFGSVEGKPEALEGVKVVELSYANFAGIITGTILAELGAEVIKIEPPSGDPARRITPYGVNVNGIGIPFLMESRNKYYVTLDLNDEEGREKFKKLASQVDIVIDAFKPGFLDSLGVGYKELRNLNKGLIYVAISPYGHTTSRGEKLRNIPDTDLTAQAGSGYPMTFGDPKEPEPYNYPLRAGLWAAWYMTALLAAASTLVALFHKFKTGEGQFIDIASHDVITSWIGASPIWGFLFKRPRVRIGEFDWTLYPYGFFTCKDGLVTVACVRDEDFRGLLKILKLWRLEDDWKYLLDRITDDIDRLKSLNQELNKAMANFTQDEIVKKALDYSAKSARSRLRAGGFPIVVKALTPSQVLKEEHWHIRNTFVHVDHPSLGRFIVPAPVPKMSETPPRVKWIKCNVGEDNELIYKKYGLL